MAIIKKPALGYKGFPGEEIWEGKRYLGKITRMGNYSFRWMAEDGQWDSNGKCIKPRSSGYEMDDLDAEKALIRVFGITQEEFE